MKAGDSPLITWYGKDLERPRWDDPELRTLCFQLEEPGENQRRTEASSLSS